MEKSGLHFELLMLWLLVNSVRLRGYVDAGQSFNNVYHYFRAVRMVCVVKVLKRKIVFFWIVLLVSAFVHLGPKLAAFNRAVRAVFTEAFAVTALL